MAGQTPIPVQVAKLGVRETLAIAGQTLRQGQMVGLGVREALAVVIVQARQQAVGEVAQWKSRATAYEAALASQALKLSVSQRNTQQSAASSEGEQASCLLQPCEGLSPAWSDIAAESDALLAAGYSAAAAAAVRDARLAEACTLGFSVSAGCHGEAAPCCSPASTPLAAVVSFTLRTVLRLPQGSTQAALLAAALDFLLHTLQPGVQPEDQAEAALHVLVPGLLSAAGDSPPGVLSTPDVLRAGMEGKPSSIPGSQASCGHSLVHATLHPAAHMLECLLQAKGCCDVEVPRVGLAALCAAAARVRSIAEALGRGVAAAGPHGASAAFPISLVHACLAYLPCWLHGAPASAEAAAREALSQATRDILGAYKVAACRGAAAAEYAEAVRAAAAELITALEVVSGQRCC